MRHAKRVKKLKRTASHRKAMLKNLATSLFEHKKLTTTVAKAKALRPYAEHLITKAKHALQNEQAGRLPEGQTVDIHNRRIVGRHIRNKAVLQELFDTIAPMVEDRPGGYTRIIKTGFRRGDAAQTAVIELVDWAAPQDGAVDKKSKKRTAAKPKKLKKKVKKVEEKVEEIKEQVVAEDTVEKVEETKKKVEEKTEEVKEEEKKEENSKAKEDDKAEKKD
jgi:large subunit ribosomal protein L17